jgi:F-box and leucine-rich repeat protein GRR1
MTDQSMRQIWLNSAHVRELRLNNNNLLTDAGFPCLRDMPNLPAHEDDFASLTLHERSRTISSSSESESSDSNSAGDLGEKNDETSIITLPKLRTTPITRKFEYLRTVDLTGCALLTDVAVESIISNASRIRTLTLAKCGLLTDAALDAICKLGKHLHYLHLGHVNQ